MRKKASIYHVDKMYLRRSALCTALSMYIGWTMSSTYRTFDADVAHNKIKANEADIIVAIARAANAVTTTLRVRAIHFISYCALKRRVW